MSNDSENPPSGGQFLVYQTQDGKLKIDVRFEGETVWLTQHAATESVGRGLERGGLGIQTGGSLLNRTFPAPAGRPVIAQGNALGIWHQTIQSPERA